MKLIEAQHGFDEFEIPEHELDLKDDPILLRCTITEGPLNGEWVEISEISFSDEINDDGTSMLNFKFDSSRGAQDDELKDFSEKLIQMVLTFTMNRPELVVDSVGC